jgi:hypothetical protein
MSSCNQRVICVRVILGHGPFEADVGDASLACGLSCAFDVRLMVIETDECRSWECLGWRQGVEE